MKLKMTINPRVDFAFKKNFGSEENTDLLISLVNSVLRISKITGLSYEDIQRL